MKKGMMMMDMVVEEEDIGEVVGIVVVMEVVIGKDMIIGSIGMIIVIRISMMIEDNGTIIGINHFHIPITTKNTKTKTIKNNIQDIHNIPHINPIFPSNLSIHTTIKIKKTIKIIKITDTAIIQINQIFQCHLIQPYLDKHH